MKNRSSSNKTALPETSYKITQQINDKNPITVPIDRPEDHEEIIRRVQQI